MPSLNVRVYDDRAIARLERVAPDARAALARHLGNVARAMASDARGRASAHIRFRGKKAPGSYVESIQGGVAEKERKILGYVRSGHPLAHLMELGFTISDWEIVPGTGKNTTSHLGAIMAFGGDAATVFRGVVHRHSTAVKPYPAILPAFEAARGEIAAAFEEAAGDAAEGSR